jgi:hypothetical protein
MLALLVFTSQGMHQPPEFRQAKRILAGVGLSDLPPEHDQIGISHQNQCDVAIPGLPVTDFIMVQAQFTLGLLKTHLNIPARTRYTSQLSQARRRRSISMIISHVFRRADAASDQEKVGKPLRTLVG